MIFNKIICCSVAMLGCVIAAGCSDDDKAVISEVGAKTMITLGRYYTGTGSTLAPSWQSGDRAAVLVAGDGRSEVSYAEPITTGSAKALFMFAVKAYRNA
ncbi:MAG: hypothetical protein K2M76_07690, partial [Muribaculaceae bacterium]|nr:hypothetical protein [Muribaculaceae bacterium]